MKQISSRAAFEKSPQPSLKITSYFAAYDALFQAYQNKEIVFVEVGVLNGGSLFMWREFFGPKARIIGVDLNPAAKKWEQDGFEIHIGDQSDPGFWKAFTAEIGEIDVFLDDGGHTYRQQIVTTECLLDSISDGGVLVVEDTCTSYMNGFGDRNSSFIEYAKLWIDRINSRSSLLPTDERSGCFVSVEYFDSMVGFKVDRKASSQESEQIWNIEPTKNAAADYRHHPSDSDPERLDHIRNIMAQAFTLNGKSGGKRFKLSRDLLFRLVKAWLEKHPGDSGALQDLVAKYPES